MATDIKFRNVSNPAAWGAEWTEPASGTVFQLVSGRGVTGLFMGMKRKGEAWSRSSPVANPERFGLHAPVKSWKEFSAIVQKFLDGAES